MDKTFIYEIMDIFSKTDIHKLKIIHDNFQIELEKGSEALKKEDGFDEKTLSALQTQQVSEVAHKIEKDKKDIEIVKSPIVGTFYSASSPGLKPFVELGSLVSKGQVLCIIEAMKVMNEIKAPCDGIIDEIYVEDGEIVQYNSPIFAIHK